MKGQRITHFWVGGADQPVEAAHTARSGLIDMEMDQSDWMRQYTENVITALQELDRARFNREVAEAQGPAPQKCRCTTRL